MGTAPSPSAVDAFSADLLLLVSATALAALAVETSVFVAARGCRRHARPRIRAGPGAGAGGERSCTLGIFPKTIPQRLAGTGLRGRCCHGRDGGYGSAARVDDGFGDDGRWGVDLPGDRREDSRHCNLRGERLLDFFNS